MWVLVAIKKTQGERTQPLAPATTLEDINNRIEELNLREKMLKAEEENFHQAMEDARKELSEEANRHFEQGKEKISAALEDFRKQQELYEIEATARIREELLSAFLEAAGQHLNEDELREMAKALGETSEESS